MQPHEELEQRFGEWAGVEHVVACSSGTAALHLALEVMQLPPRSEVLIPDWTMVACARAVSLAGLKPVFVDCGEDLLMDMEDAVKRVTERTVAVMPVHIYGRRCDKSYVVSVAKGKMPSLFVVEDLAEAHGIKPHSQTDAACWSFYKNKIVAGEEGGAVAFKDPKYVELARSLRCLGMTERHDFHHSPRGHNYRMSNCHAELILRSLGEVEQNVRERRRLETICDGLCPEWMRMPPRDAPWVYDMRAHGMNPTGQEALLSALREEGVQARHGFKPMTMQPEYRDGSRRGSSAWKMASEVFYLPLHPRQTTEEVIDRAFRTIRRVLG